MFDFPLASFFTGQILSCNVSCNVANVLHRGEGLFTLVERLLPIHDGAANTRGWRKREVETVSIVVIINLH